MAFFFPVPAPARDLRINSLVGSQVSFLGFQNPPSGNSSVSQSAEAEVDSAAAKPQSLTLEEVLAHDVLEPLQKGVSTRNVKQVLSVLSPQVTANYPELRDQFQALLDNATALQFRYKLLQVTSDRDHASAICEADLDATPRDETLTPVRRSAQLTFQLKRTTSGWKVVTFSPADFFAQ
jgi:hypothetical protein